MDFGEEGAEAKTETATTVNPTTNTAPTTSVPVVAATVVPSDSKKNKFKRAPATHHELAFEPEYAALSGDLTPATTHPTVTTSGSADLSWPEQISASRYGSAPQIIQTLLKSKDKDAVDTPAEGGITPLMVASYRGFSDLIFHLLAAKANPNARANNGCTALHAALLTSEEDRAPLAFILLEAKANADLIDDAGLTPLCKAIEEKYSQVEQQLELIEILLKGKADANAVSHPTSTKTKPLHTLRVNKDLNFKTQTKILKLLIEYKAEPEAYRGGKNLPPLYSKIVAGDPQLFKTFFLDIPTEFIFRKINKDIHILDRDLDEHGRTLYHWVAMTGDSFSLVQLMRADLTSPKILAADKNGDTPLHHWLANVTDWDRDSEYLLNAFWPQRKNLGFHIDHFIDVLTLLDSAMQNPMYDKVMLENLGIPSAGGTIPTTEELARYTNFVITINDFVKIKLKKDLVPLTAADIPALPQWYYKGLRIKLALLGILENNDWEGLSKVWRFIKTSQMERYRAINPQFPKCNNLFQLLPVLRALKYAEQTTFAAPTDSPLPQINFRAKTGKDEKERKLSATPRKPIRRKKFTEDLGSSTYAELLLPTQRKSKKHKRREPAEEATSSLDFEPGKKLKFRPSAAPPSVMSSTSSTFFSTPPITSSTGTALGHDISNLSSSGEKVVPRPLAIWSSGQCRKETPEFTDVCPYRR